MATTTVKYLTPTAAGNVAGAATSAILTLVTVYTALYWVTLKWVGLWHE